MQGRFRTVSCFVAASLACLTPSAVSAKQATSSNVQENKETFASIGDVLVKVTLRESLPNAFGGADIFGRKRDRGFVEVRFMGLATDGRAVFRRRTVDIYSNETTMSRSGMRYGSADVQYDNNSAHIQSYSVGPQQATVQALPPDTVEFALDLTKGNLITIEDRQIQVLSADDAGVKFVVQRR